MTLNYSSSRMFMLLTHIELLTHSQPALEYSLLHSANYLFSLLEPQAKVCSATVYDVQGCNKDVICNVIKKSTTRSVINMDPDLVDSIPENDHLLYISSDGGHQPAFIQRNLDRWWGQQTSNSSTFYFSPQHVSHRFVYSSQATIAHIFISLITPSR